MKSFFLNRDTGDIEFDGQHNIKMTSGEAEEEQSVWLVLRTNLGEWFLNTLHGLDYSAILTKSPSEALIRAAVLTALSQESRVEKVESVTTEFDSNRVGTISFVAKMASGNVVESGVSV